MLLSFLDLNFMCQTESNRHDDGGLRITPFYSLPGAYITIVDVNNELAPWCSDHPRLQSLYPGHFWLCGNQAHSRLPINAKGRCTFGHVAVQGGGIYVQDSSLPRFVGRKTRDLSSLWQSVGTWFGKAAIAISTWNPVGNLIMREQLELNALAIERLGNQTSKGLKLLSDKIEEIRVYVMQNRLALDYLLAKENGFCSWLDESQYGSMFKDKCCMEIKSIEQNVSDVIENIEQIVTDVRESRTFFGLGWLASWFGLGRYKELFVSIFITFITCIVCLVLGCAVLKACTKRIVAQVLLVERKSLLGADKGDEDEEEV
ncbi:syncytin-2-like [Pelodiscus sinensis]|uniref:syncytin-2-like n=1 Tax=Pelodiscus sinensis TaxID=13735 RepID=UPI003F6D969A